ncbi:hypothetical protein [Bartonella tamiae]|uniref:phage adaptor protein n=1 Tax=Bartonella tamiae TaxID=373638 RepID=UPI00026E77AA|nr:hypothetical protein [Bartonella tamiae]EJF92649.1 hypothetical protein MEG_01819 [Bartonella tamiae Th307]
MSINVITSGPINSLPDILDPKASTFNNMLDVIADEIDDTTNEYFTQIQRCIFSAIRFCEREIFYFNESRDVVFPLQEGKEFYDQNDAILIGQIVGITNVFLDNGTTTTELRREDPAELERLSNNKTLGEPYAYGYFDKQLRLYPAPQSNAGTIRIQVTPIRLDTIKNANDNGAWFIDAFDLVKARAKYDLYKDILKDATMAAASLNDFNEQLQALRVETSRRNGIGKIRTTSF